MIRTWDDVENPTDRLVTSGHLMAADFRVAVRHADNVTEALRLRAEIDHVVQVLEHVSRCALDRANQLCGEK